MDQARFPIVALLTDFGTADHYVAAMKGVVLEAEPSATLVDISHDVPPQDVWAANFLLQAVYRCFPLRTVFLCVVDPGVGSSRRPLVVSTERYIFVAPDNGLLSCVLSGEDPVRAFEIAADHYFRKPISRTFHGRDIFAPVAGWLAHGIEPFNFGPEFNDPVRLDVPKVRRVSDQEFIGAVLHVDRFGNLITNFSASDMEMVVGRGNLAFRFTLGSLSITQYRSAYAEAPAGEVFAISGSSGYVEFSVREGSAAGATGLRRHDPVQLLFG